MTKYYDIGEYLFRDEELRNFFFEMQKNVHENRRFQPIDLDYMAHLNEIYLKELGRTESEMIGVAKKLVHELIDRKQAIQPSVFCSGYCLQHKSYVQVTTPIEKNQRICLEHCDDSLLARLKPKCPKHPKIELEVGKEIIYMLPRDADGNISRIKPNKYGIMQVSCRGKALPNKSAAKTLHLEKTQTLDTVPEQYLGKIMDGKGLMLTIKDGSDAQTIKLCKKTLDDIKEIMQEKFNAYIAYEKDYLSKPGDGGYRAGVLVAIVNNSSFEIQVRSQKMHFNNEQSPELNHDTGYMERKMREFYNKLQRSKKIHMYGPTLTAYYHVFDKKGHSRNLTYYALDHHLDTLQKIMREKKIRQR